MSGSVMRASMALGVVSLAGVLAVSVPAASGAANGADGPHKAPAIGDRCLIGTWRDNGGTTTTRWLGHTVTMRTRGGDFDHISASGHDRDTWAASKPLVGHYRGHRLTEQVRGRNSLLLRATSGSTGSVVETEQGWSAHSSNRYVYRGQHSKGYLNQSGDVTAGFHCTLTTLTFLDKKGKPQSRETRVRFEP